MQIATVFNNDENTFYKAVIDKTRGTFSVSGWKICKKEEREKNKRILYYKAMDVDDLLSFMITLAPFKKKRMTNKDDGIFVKYYERSPWIWKKSF